MCMTFPLRKDGSEYVVRTGDRCVCSEGKAAPRDVRITDARSERWYFPHPYEPGIATTYVQPDEPDLPNV